MKIFTASAAFLVHPNHLPVILTAHLLIVNTAFLLYSMNCMNPQKEVKQICCISKELSNLDKKILKEENKNLKEDNAYLNQEIQVQKQHADTLLSEKTDLVISNSELNAKVQELEVRIAKLEERVAVQGDRIMKLENIFYKNGISKEKLEEVIEENEKKD